MSSEGLVDTQSAVTRILRGTPPPLVADVFGGGTRLTGAWQNPAFEGHVPALREHCIVRHVSGCSEGGVKLDGKATYPTMVPGTISLVPRGQACWRRSRSPMITTNVYLGADCLQACADQVAHGQKPELIDRMGFNDPKLFVLLGLLADEATSSEPTSRLFVEQLIDLVCLQLLRSHSSLAVRAQPLARRGLAAWQVKRLTHYMGDHLDRDVRLEELASLVGLSRFHLCHAFRLATGRTPHDWLVTLRIDKAKKLLAAPGLRIIDVALAVGYQTPSAFAASFRRFTGVTPSEFRRRL